MSVISHQFNPLLSDSQDSHSLHDDYDAICIPSYDYYELRQ
jgi:hypothetical protein